MPQINFKYWALHYLNLWLSKDRKFCEALEGADDGAKLEAIASQPWFKERVFDVYLWDLGS
jgi:hypothetical protein